MPHREGPGADLATTVVAPGTLLKDRYRLERLLGRGGMASVWLAGDQVLERPVAVKIIADTIASDSEFRARFRREARIAAGLSHPNLIRIYDYADRAERPYLVMEYVPGDNLAQRLSSHGKIESERLTRELLGALTHIHAADIVHRDIKPQNVLIAADDSAKLIDFGIALPADATALTRTGNLLGTARYIAPEVMRGERATERSDLYSCGVVLRDCLGSNPPASLRALVERLCAEDPLDRPASAREALTQLKRRVTIPAQPTEVFDDPVRTKPNRPRRTWGKGVGVLAACAALAGGFLFLSRDSGEKPEKPPPSQVDKAADDRGTADAGPSAAGAAPSTTAGVPEPTGSDDELGSTLNQEGFELIQAGDYEGAVPLLEEAVRAFSPDTEDLDYAYALFNLGNALRLSGRPEEAIPVLERRLAIPNQSGVVREELAAARSEASS